MPNCTKFWFHTTLVSNFGPNRKHPESPKTDRYRPTHSRFQAKSGRSRSRFGDKFGRTWTKLGRSRRLLDESSKTKGRFRPDVDEDLSNLADFRPNLVEADQDEDEFAQGTATKHEFVSNVSADYSLEDEHETRTTANGPRMPTLQLTWGQLMRGGTPPRSKRCTWRFA